MAERQRTEISAELLDRVRAVAEAQGRPVSEVLEEAVVGYLSFLYARVEFAERSYEEDTAGVGRPFRREHVEPSPSWRTGSLAGLFSLVEGWQRERGVEPLSDDEAMRLAVEEQHAMRDERGARR